MVQNLPAMQETWVQSLDLEDPLEEGMATHCSILAWRIPWTEEPGSLQFMGLQRIRHDWVIITHTGSYSDSQVVQWQGIHLPRQETWVWSLGQEDLLEKETATHSSFLPGKFHEQRSLASYSPWGRKESDITECTYMHDSPGVNRQKEGSLYSIVFWLIHHMYLGHSFPLSR